MESQLWWYLARATGLIAWVLLSATVVWGLLLTTRVIGPRMPSKTLSDLHRFLSGLTMVFLALHLLTLVADTWVDIGLAQLLIPFTSSYRPLAVSYGVVALYLLTAIVVTSVLKNRIPYRWWRSIHASSFLAFLLTGVHALTAGTDVSINYWVELTVGAVFGTLALYRLLAGSRTATNPSTDLPTDPPTDPPTVPATATAVTGGGGGGGGGGDARSGSTIEVPAGGELDESRTVVVRELRWVAEGVITVELVAEQGHDLPAWEPGAHIDLHLPSGRVGRYSLCGDPSISDAYRIAVLQVPQGWVSGEIHGLRVAQRLAVTGPRNRFPLVLAERYLFIAGGIGITPILPMVRAVAAAGRDWWLIYGGRSHSSMAFTDELLALDPDRVRLVAEDTDGPLALAAALAGTARGTAVYSCGPEPLLTHLQNLTTESFPARHLHIEHFGAAPAAQRQPRASPGEAEFKVELNRSGEVLDVAADQNLLDVIRQAAKVPSSCEEGYCGTCRLRVLDGIPDHRDTVLRTSERDRRDVIYPCVSRARSPFLVIDL